MRDSTDILIVGAGVIGCAIAFELRKQGATVRVLERGRIGQEASSAAAGILSPQLEAGCDSPFFRLCLEARSLFPAYLDEIEDRTGVTVEWHEAGCVEAAFTAEDEAEMRARFRWQERAGLQVRYWGCEEIRDLEPELHPDVRFAAFLPGEAHLDNAQYTLALARAARESGAEILEGTEVEGLAVAGGRVIGARVAGSEFQAGWVVNAAGAWGAHLPSWEGAPFPIAPVRGQMVALRTEDPVTERLLYSPRCYLVPRWGNLMLAGATVEDAGYDKRNTAGGIEGLLRSACELLPSLRSATFVRAWAGLRPGTPDALPILGPDPVWEGLVHATGHFRNGILLSALTGSLVASHLAGHRDLPADFLPSRFRRRNVGPALRL